MNGLRALIAGGIIAVLVVAALPAQTAQETDAHPAGACSAPYYVSHAGWDLCWQRDDPRAQGLEINQAYFQGQSIVWKMGVPFSMTKYDNAAIGPYKDTLGTPGAGSHPGYGLGALTLSPSVCPRFLSSGALLDGGKVCVETSGGVEPALVIWSKYNIYNYRFIQGWKFDSRGHIEPLIRMGGNLIDGSSGANGNNHFHHLIWRVDFDIGAPGNDEFQVFSRNAGASPLNGGTLGQQGCEFDGTGGTAAWCSVLAESALQIQRNLFMKFRVKDAAVDNSQGHAQSYEFRVNNGDGGADHFSTMDAMVVQYKSDSSELGYEVPTNPVQGDKNIYPYLAGDAPITDPVAWMFLHIYHDTRDEDRPSMSYHEIRGDIQPHNMFGTNPGELSFP